MLDLNLPDHLEEESVGSGTSSPAPKEISIPTSRMSPRASWSMSAPVEKGVVIETAKSPCLSKVFSILLLLHYTSHLLYYRKTLGCGDAGIR